MAVDYDKLMMNYNFVVSIKNTEVRVSKISNIEGSVETETLQEGGLNHYVHVMVKPAQGMKKLVLERGFYASGDSADFEKLLGKRQSSNISILIYDRAHKEILHSYSVTGWTIVSWKLAELDAARSSVLLETAEIAYETLQTV